MKMRFDIKLDPAIERQIRRNKATGKKLSLRKGTLAPLLPPDSLERRYKRFLRERSRDLQERIRLELIPQLPFLIEQAQVLERSLSRDARLDQSFVDSVLKVTEAIAAAHLGQFSDTQTNAMLVGLASDLNGWSRENINRLMRRAIGVDVFSSIDPKINQKLEDFVAENVELIKSAEAAHIDKIKKSVINSARQGIRHEELAKRIQEISPDSRFELIARDQTASFNGTLNKLRQQDIGLGRYIWRTSRDERVRGNPGGRYPNAIPSHFKLEGVMFSWNSPIAVDGSKKKKPRGLDPGLDYQCRCYAEPVIEDILDAEPSS